MSDDERRSILGEFSAAHKKDFEIPQDRDFKQTKDAQLEMNDERQFEVNSLKQRLDAEIDDLAAKTQNTPTFSLSNDYSVDQVDQYNEIISRYEGNSELVEVKYTNIRDQIRDNGVTLVDEFENIAAEPLDEIETSLTDLEQLGIDTQNEFNIESDTDYYRHESANDFIEPNHNYDENYGSHYEGDFDFNDNGNINGNSDGKGR